MPRTQIGFEQFYSDSQQNHAKYFAQDFRA
jgi:hypothetical protein